MKRILLVLAMTAVLMLIGPAPAFAAEGPKSNEHGCAGINTAIVHNKHSEFIETFPGAQEPPLCFFEV